jgi:hypothetical protein
MNFAKKGNLGWIRGLNLLHLARSKVLYRRFLGIKCRIGTEPGQAPAFEIEEFKEKVRLIPLTAAGLRDRALLLVDFVGAFRRSELVPLNVEGIQFTREGGVISHRDSKTNQYGKTEQKVLFFSAGPETCPVRALQGLPSTSWPNFRPPIYKGKERRPND